MGGSPVFAAKDEESHAIRRLPYLYPATVTDNQDPKKLRRVRVMIPNLIEPESPWALPMGTAGGGSSDRGGVIVPEVGATVAVQFAFGDPAHPYYTGGPQAADEVPDDVADDPDKFAIRYDDFEVRWEKDVQLLHVKNRRTGDEVSFSGLTGAVRVHGVASLELSSVGKVAITGAVLELNGRPVLPGGPIR